MPDDDAFSGRAERARVVGSGDINGFCTLAGSVIGGAGGFGTWWRNTDERSRATRLRAEPSSALRSACSSGARRPREAPPGTLPEAESGRTSIDQSAAVAAPSGNWINRRAEMCRHAGWQTRDTLTALPETVAGCTGRAARRQPLRLGVTVKLKDSLRQTFAEGSYMSYGVGRPMKFLPCHSYCAVVCEKVFVPQYLDWSAFQAGSRSLTAVVLPGAASAAGDGGPGKPDPLRDGLR